MHFPIFSVHQARLMRIVCLLVLSCAFPLIALSQIQPDKAILEAYAHPAFVRALQSSAKKIILDEQQHTYVASSTPEVFARPTNEFVIVKQVSPTVAIVSVDKITIAAAEKLFQYMVPAGNLWKASPTLLKALKVKTEMQLILAVKDAAAFKALFPQVQVMNEYKNALVVKAVDAEALLNADIVLFADAAFRNPKEELIVSGFDPGTNRANVAHHYFPTVTGEGLMVSIKENRFDTADIDLKGRIVNNNLASTVGSGHATIMATMMAGAGNSFYQGKGVAWKAGMQSANFTNLMPEPDTYYSGQNISVQNHSYGTGIENFYGADASAYDATVVTNPALLHVFSAGNSGLLASSGPYAGITGYANLTGSFKMAKNNLVVGAIDSIGNVEGPSSKGPAYDGRVKPELVAFGQDGSSGSAAVVSGIALLMQHAYQQQHGALPAAALVKAVLINTADDLGNKGPDFASGYGNANAYEALRSLTRSQYFSNSIQQGNTQTFNLTIPAGIQLLKVTLAWTDPAAQANAVKALVNDLDLELVHVNSGQVWQPWTLSRFPNKDSLMLPAVRNRDTLNNVEQVTIDAPPAGDYTVQVKGSRVTNSQAYFIAYAADTLNKFEWMYPMPADPIEAGTRVLLRWKGVFSTSTLAQLQYTLDGANWQTISTNINANTNYFRWSAPDTFSTAMLRMTVGPNSYTTDTFVISKLINTHVGFNCPDSFLFSWNRPKGVSSFRVYRLGSKFLEPVTVTNDTFFIAAKNASSSMHYTVAPVIKSKEGMRAYTFDYTSQGVGCYFKSFLALLNGSKADLFLELGSLYNVKKLTLQKLSGNSFADIQTLPLALLSNYTDATLSQGVNTYRVALQLADGRIIYSNNEIVYFLNNTDYLVYPNPVHSGNTFRIQQKEPVEIRVLMHDATGRLVKDEIYSDLVNPVNIAGLQKGLYVITIVKDGANVFRGKVIIN
jgi:hypothetical protein